MTAKVRVRRYNIELSASQSGLLSELDGQKGLKIENVDSFFITAVGAGTLTITPKFEAITTHTSYTVTNDSIWLDFTGATDFTLAETSTSDPVTVIITAYRGD